MKRNNNSAQQASSKQRTASEQPTANSTQAQQPTGINSAKAAADTTADAAAQAKDALNVYNNKVQQHTTAAKQVKQVTNNVHYVLRELARLTATTDVYYCSELAKLEKQYNFAARYDAAAAQAKDADARRKAKDLLHLTINDLLKDNVVWSEKLADNTEKTHTTRFCTLCSTGTTQDIEQKQLAADAADKKAKQYIVLCTANSDNVAQAKENYDTAQDAATTAQDALKAAKKAAKDAKDAKDATAKDAQDALKAAADAAADATAKADAAKAEFMRFSEIEAQDKQAAQDAAVKADAAAKALATAQRTAETAAKNNWIGCEIDGVQYYLRPVTNFTKQAVINSAKDAYRIATADEYTTLKQAAADAAAKAKDAKDTAKAADAAAKALAKQQLKRAKIDALQKQINALSA